MEMEIERSMRARAPQKMKRETQWGEKSKIDQIRKKNIRTERE